MPSIGAFSSFDLNPGQLISDVRIETGVDRRSEVTPFYDPMIAKLIVHRGSRAEAAWALCDLCEVVQVAPVRTNAGFLARCLGHSEFVDGSVDTGFIERHGDGLFTPADDREAMAVDAGAGVFGDLVSSMRDPATIAPAFRLNASRRAVGFATDDQGAVYQLDLLRYTSPDWRYFYNHAFSADPRSVTIFNDGEATSFRGWRPDGGAAATSGDGAILSPMPGRIIAVDVAAGDSVTKGQKLVTLEAMKMEHSLTAPFDGVVAELNATVGGQVQVEALLVRIEVAGD